MKAKLLIIGQISEQHIATFNNVADAFHAGSLLQASTEDANLMYYVEFKEKGVSKRQLVDRFTRRLPFLNKETHADLAKYYYNLEFGADGYTLSQEQIILKQYKEELHKDNDLNYNIGCLTPQEYNDKKNQINSIQKVQ